LATELESDFSEFSFSEHDRSLAGDRWGATADDKLVKQPWRIQRVWGRAGEICNIDAERSIDSVGLMEIFSSDDVLPNDRLSMEYSYDILSKAKTLPVTLPLANALKEVYEVNEADEKDDVKETKLTVSDSSEDDYHQEPGDHSVTSWISGHESVSFVEEDPLDENEFEASLSALEFDGDEDEEETTSEIDKIREKLRNLEMMIELLIQNDDSTGEKRKAYQKMQEKCVEHLNDLSAQLAKLDGDKAATSCQILENIPTELFKIGAGKDESDEEDVPSRKESLIRKKLRKTEKQMNRMVAEGGDQRKQKKAYKKLEEKRNGLLKELGTKVQQLEVGPPSRANRTSNAEMPISTSLHTLLSDLKILDVILEEDDNNSRCSMEEERRDTTLLRKKISKAEKEMRKIVTERGNEGKSGKRYQQLERKLVQYNAELGSEETAQRNKVARTNSKGGASSPSFAIIRKRVESAIDIMKMSMDETTTTTSHNKKSLSPTAPKPSYPTLAGKRGGWASPLSFSGQPESKDDSKFRLHSFDCVIKE
jgi:hypothetical protein